MIPYYETVNADAGLKREEAVRNSNEFKTVGGGI